jgi:acetolactate decarboxylase
MLEERRRQNGADYSTIVDSALCSAFGLDQHTLFQVSTSNALVQGVFAGAITVGELKRHGDMGLGTFAGLDGELVMVDGECFRASAGGAAEPAPDDQEVPFGLVTRFSADLVVELEAISSIASLHAQLNRYLPSQNLFLAVRIEGRFEHLAMRAACPARKGEGLAEATRHQSEFDLTEATGTLVGFWAPEYSRSVSVPGYHFHFISSDRERGGHLLDLEAGRLRAELQVESEIHLAIPETEQFLAADLAGDHRQELAEAESGSAAVEADR